MRQGIPQSVATARGCERRFERYSRCRAAIRWSSEEGTIVIEQKGDTVLVSESLDPATTSALEGEVFGVAMK